jgi:hypothetical protein
VASHTPFRSRCAVVRTAGISLATEQDQGQRAETMRSSSPRAPVPARWPVVTARSSQPSITHGTIVRRRPGVGAPGVTWFVTILSFIWRCLPLS